LPPIPERSMSPRATSKLWWWIVSKALDLKRPIREADIDRRRCMRRIQSTSSVSCREKHL
jgi:hypothetical protein